MMDTTSRPYREDPAGQLVAMVRAYVLQTAGLRSLRDRRRMLRHVKGGLRSKSACEAGDRIGVCVRLLGLVPNYGVYLELHEPSRVDES